MAILIIITINFIWSIIHLPKEFELALNDNWVFTNAVLFLVYIGIFYVLITFKQDISIKIKNCISNVVLFFSGVSINLSTANNAKKSIELNDNNIDCINDNPPLSMGDDVLGREDLVKKMYRFLECSNSAIINIDASWGYGKTTVVNFIKEYIECTNKEKGEEIIQMDFNPWQYAREKKLIQAFFDELHNVLQNNTYTIRKLENIVTETYWLAKILSTVSGSRATLDEAKNNFSDALDNRKLYIYIDDIDRLVARDIIEVFKVIALFSNQKNIYFILSFSQKEVGKILKANKFIIDDEDVYFEKMINRTYPLSTPEGKIDEFIKARLQNIIGDSEKVAWLQYNTTMSKRMWDSSDLDRTLIACTNLRQAKKVLASFKEHYDYFKEEFCVKVIYNMTLLQIFFVDIYKDLNEKSSIYASKHNNSNDNKKLKKQYEDIVKNRPELDTILSDLFGDNGCEEKIDGNTTNKIGKMTDEAIQIWFAGELPTGLESRGYRKNLIEYFSSQESKKQKEAIVHKDFLKDVVAHINLNKVPDFLDRLDKDLEQNIHEISLKILDSKEYTREQLGVIIYWIGYCVYFDTKHAIANSFKSANNFECLLYFKFTKNYDGYREVVKNLLKDKNQLNSYVKIEKKAKNRIWTLLKKMSIKVPVPEIDIVRHLYNIDKDITNEQLKIWCKFKKQYIEYIDTHIEKIKNDDIPIQRSEGTIEDWEKERAKIEQTCSSLSK